MNNNTVYTQSSQQKEGIEGNKGTSRYMSPKKELTPPSSEGSIAITQKQHTHCGLASFSTPEPPSTCTNTEITTRQKQRSA